MDNEMNMHYANELRAHLESIISVYDLLSVHEQSFLPELESKIREARRFLAKLKDLED